MAKELKPRQADDYIIIVCYKFKVNKQYAGEGNFYHNVHETEIKLSHQELAKKAAISLEKYLKDSYPLDVVTVYIKSMDFTTAKNIWPDYFGDNNDNGSK